MSHKLAQIIDKALRYMNGVAKIDENDSQKKSLRL